MFSRRIRCEIPPEVREYVRVTSWLHEEGTAIEIFPEKVKRWFHNLIKIDFLFKMTLLLTIRNLRMLFINHRSQEENTPCLTNHKVVIYSFIIHQLMILTRNIFVRLNINWREFVDEVYNQLGWFLQVRQKNFSCDCIPY